METMPYELIAHGIFSFASGLTVAVTGFGCDYLRVIVDRLSVEPGAYPASSAINMGLSAALVTATQAVWYRRQINGGLLLSVLPLTFIGVLLSLNVFSSSVLAALVPAVGACLLGLSLTKLWMNLADCRNKDSVREGTPDRRGDTSSWKWTGVLGTASLAGGLLSGWCPPPGPVFMVVLLSTEGGAKVNGGEWRATAALVTCTASFLRVGLLLLENGAAVGPMPEVLFLVGGGLLGIGAGNASLGLCSPRGVSNPDQSRSRTPTPAAFRRLVIAVALASSIAMATGGPPDALSLVARELTLGTLVLVCVVAVAGAVWGCTGGADRRGGARGAYANVASDEQAEVQLKPLAARNGPDRRGDRGDYDYDGDDDEYLDEEDGYLADEGEMEPMAGRGRRAREPRRVGFSLPSRVRSPAATERGEEDDFVGGGQVQRGPGENKEKDKPTAARGPSRFPEGHTSEL